ncbi:nucleotidyltransferase family protein [Candidatus Omnitrophota bacterium]
MKVIILAAGYATRLWPLTLDKPKPLLKVGSKSIIDHIFSSINNVKGIKTIYVVTNSKFVNNFAKWKTRYPKKRIVVVDDGIDSLNERRGSIGDILFTINKKKIKEDILVVAGDNIFDFAIDDFVKTSKANSPYVTTGLFDVKDMELAKQYGIVAVNRNSKIISFEEKPAKPKSTLAAMCLYYFPKEKLKLIRKYQRDGNPLDLAGTFIKWVSRKESVYGYKFNGRWLDIGDKKSLKRAQKLNWNQKRRGK